MVNSTTDPPLVEGDVAYPDSESDIEDEYKHVTVETIDQTDILNESKEWDTDLEIEGVYIHNTELLPVLCG